MRTSSSQPGPTLSALPRRASPSHDLVLDRALDQQPAAGDAGLAHVLEGAIDRAGERRLEVGVGEDHVRVLAAELERDPLERRGAGTHDQAPDLGRAGERDLAHRWV